MNNACENLATATCPCECPHLVRANVTSAPNTLLLVPILFPVMELCYHARLSEPVRHSELFREILFSPVTGIIALQV
jgi:hypothetical protein